MDRIDLHEKAIKTLNLIEVFRMKRDNLQEWCDKYLDLFPTQKESHLLEIHVCNQAITRLQRSYEILINQL